MSVDNTLNGIQSISTTIQSGVNVVSRAAADAGFGNTQLTGYWKDRLQQASYRGVPFGVLSGSVQFGRRNVVHQYPFRDTVWVEDLGKSARRITMVGFLIENPRYSGVSDVIAQRERFIAAAEAPGDGELVHPSLGRMTVSNMTCTAQERWDQGRVFELALSFIEGGNRIFPTISTATKDAVESTCVAADYAASQDFIARTSNTLTKGASVVSQAANTAAAWARKAQKLANDATNLYNMVGNLKGGFGRYFGGRNTGISGAAAATAGAATTVAGLIAAGSAARTGVASAISNLTTMASGLGS